jgi:hypothetical protein
LDIRDAYAWYEKQMQGFGRQLSYARGCCLDGKFKGARHQYPVIYRNARRCLVRRFPMAFFM